MSDAPVCLRDSQRALLKEIVAKRAPQLTQLVSSSSIVISAEQKREIQELLGDELTETGLGDDLEPTQRGLEVENLIDAFSPYK